ncbi:MAG: helix-turn-helix transcriptional regulator [Schaedlerella sp.]|nr:helix-turn-helix transcriptional regulator [Schaedlerella sp.]
MMMKCNEETTGIFKEVPDIAIDRNLKKLREKNNMSQEMLARKLHIKRQTVSSYETGRSLPDLFILIKIADIFGITLDELVGRKIE